MVFLKPILLADPSPAEATLATKLEISLQNPSGHLKVETRDCDGDFQNRFTLEDPTWIGIGRPHKLEEPDARGILALACSMSNDKSILFARVQSRGLGGSRQSPPSAPQAKITPSGKDRYIEVGEVLSFNENAERLAQDSIILDEPKLREVAGRLLATRPFCKRKTKPYDTNIRESLQAYLGATEAQGPDTRYKGLYTAFEKAVNADCDRSGERFDAAASARCALSQSQIGILREYHNRLKHAQRSNRDLAKLSDLNREAGTHLRTLKAAADRALLSRI